MKLNNRLGQYLIAMLIVLYCTTNVVHALTEDQEVRVRNATVFIETENGIGTGFYIKPNAVATCLHLVAGANKITIKSKNKKGFNFLGLGKSKKEKDLGYSGLMAYDKTDNLAILRVLESNSNHLEISTDPVVQDEEILAVGYDENGRFRIKPSKIKRHSYKDFCHTGIRFPIIISSDGGLVLDLHGKVKGIFFIGILEVTPEFAELNYSFVVPANKLKALLDKPWSYTMSETVELEFDHCKLIRQGNAKLRKSRWLDKSRRYDDAVHYYNLGKNNLKNGLDKFLKKRNIPIKRIGSILKRLSKLI